ncbi:MAG: hypothetical protein FJ171_04455 [Gammaproteobacteria bacterium]|nr:hypothetical protein [Gammaproteobacteria bacterium]
MNRYLAIMVNTVLAGAALGIGAVTPAMAASEQPFKQTNIHFETNATACDMGIQMSFDTDGLTEGEVEGPCEQVMFSFRAIDGVENTGDLTEMFHERVEPPITDLLDALDCEPPEHDPISLAELFGTWPAGWYEFDGESNGVEFEGRARLTHKIPAGPEILAPEDGAVVPHDANLLIRWKKVTGPLLPSLGPVEVVGYHVVLADVTDPALAPGRTKTVLDADLAKSETSFLVPKQFLEPGRIYEFEILSTEKYGNQTITEGGVFCTSPIAAADCEGP